MGIQTALSGIQNAIINNFSGFTTNNCSIGDEAIFNYIQTVDGAPDKCCMIEFNGFRSADKSEFRSATIRWSIVVNAFFSVLMPTDPDYVTPLANGRAFIDNLILMCAQNPTLDGTVMMAKVSGGDPPMSYRRGTNYEYVLFVAEIEVTDNIS